MKLEDYILIPRSLIQEHEIVNRLNGLLKSEYHSNVNACGQIIWTYLKNNSLSALPLVEKAFDAGIALATEDEDRLNKQDYLNQDNF